MPRSSWKLIGKDQVTLELSPNANYEKANCLLTEFQKARLSLKLGFVGHEYYTENAT